MQIFIDNLVFETWPIGVFLLGLVLLRHRNRSAAYLFCVAVFGIYLLCAFEMVFFPVRILREYLGAQRLPFPASVNLIPLNFDFSELPHIVARQIFQNILLTIPFGFGLSFVAVVRARDFRWIAPAVGISIEAVQLLLSLLLGYHTRVIDINDALLNAFGVLVGYGGFRVFAWLYTRFISDRGYYLDEVVRRA